MTLNLAEWKKEEKQIKSNVRQASGELVQCNFDEVLKFAARLSISACCRLNPLDVLHLSNHLNLFMPFCFYKNVQEAKFSNECAI
ncbi:CLUMA_CG006413, isoform A [Clunio marinus]|uniref:CLUMA_CG006413, isoform A n=1 Tax=Clunio marinus TaxID=568069 RepID=A0A1J1I1Z4_9DIPT|nr:CLUMA_CG006413, isoform A [Clunio marinus]